MTAAKDYIRWIRTKIGHEKIILVFAGGCIFNEQGKVLLQRRGGSRKHAEQDHCLLLLRRPAGPMQRGRPSGRDPLLRPRHGTEKEKRSKNCKKVKCLAAQGNSLPEWLSDGQEK